MRGFFTTLVSLAVGVVAWMGIFFLLAVAFNGHVAGGVMAFSLIAGGGGGFVLTKHLLDKI